VIESVFDCIVRRGHVVITHRHEDFEIRVLRQSIAQGDTRVDVVIVGSPVPGADTATENVVFEICLVTEFSANVVVEGRSVRRANSGFTRIVISTISGDVCVLPFESTVEPTNRSSFGSKQFLAE